MDARPFSKSVGGKTSSLPFLLRHAPTTIRTYFEPMVGGGALFYALRAQGRFGHAWLNDANQELMLTYKVVRDNPEALIWQLGGMRNTKATFLKWRAQPVHMMSHVERAARFIYLNKTCFNGLYRVNSKGQFNVPFGHYSNPKICDRDNLRACSETLALVDLTATARYVHCFASARPGDLVYLDPPYVPKTATANFTGYTAGGWGEADHLALGVAFDDLARRGVAVMLSNSDTQVARHIYRLHRIERTRVRRSVNRDGDGRGNVGEILVLANCGEGYRAIAEGA